MDGILNWLWQGALVALATSTVVWSMGPWRAEARYRTLWGGLLLVLLLPLVPALTAALAVVASPGQTALATPAIAVPVAAWWSSPAIVWSLCLVWPVSYLIHACVAWLALRRVKQSLAVFPTDVEARLRWWTSVKGTGRHTQLALSTGIRSAAVLGCAPPVIAIAPSLLDQLEQEDLDRIVIHEWAHVQRRDDVTNVLLVLVRTLAGWHPAVWWLDRQLKAERESACDEMVVGLTGAAKDYARCLTRLAGLPSAPVSPLASLAILSSTGLRHRVVRILSLGRHVAGQPRPFFMKTTGLALGLLAISVGSVRLFETVLPSTSTIVTPLMTLPATAARDALTHEWLSSRSSVVAASARGARALAIPEHGTAGDPSTAVDRSAGTSMPEARSIRSDTGTPAASPVETPTAAVPSRPLATHTALGAPSLQQTASLVVSEANASADAAKPSPWKSAAEAGIAVGRSSKEAGLATAGFFSRVGGRIAASF